MHLLDCRSLIQGETARCCPACGSKDIETLGNVPEAFHFCAFRYRHPINRSRLVVCRNCDLHFKNPCLSRKVLDDLYQQQPATVWGSTTSGRKDISHILSLLGNTPGPGINILDVGCYTGSVLKTLKESAPSGKTFNLYGLEPSKEAAKIAASHGITILGTSVADLSTSPPEFDLILLTDVFEHIFDGKDFLIPLRRSLRPNGYLVIVTGAFDSAPFLRWKSAYHYCAMPEHVAFISRRHALFLAQELDLKLSDYTLMFHTDHHPNTFKSFLKSVPYWLLHRLPTGWFCAKPPFFHKVAQQRGKGVQNLRAQPDHALVVLQRN